MMQTGVLNAYVADPPLITLMAGVQSQIEPSLGPL